MREPTVSHEVEEEKKGEGEEVELELLEQERERGERMRAELASRAAAVRASPPRLSLKD